MSLPSAVPPRMLRAALAVAEAVFSTPEHPMPPARLDWLAVELADFLTRAGVRARFVLRLALLAISVAAPLFIARIPPLRRLPLALRTRALARMEDSAIAAPVLAVKAMLCVVYYDHPDVLREVGVVGQGTIAPGELLARRVAS